MHQTQFDPKPNPAIKLNLKVHSSPWTQQLEKTKFHGKVQFIWSNSIRWGRQQDAVETNKASETSNSDLVLGLLLVKISWKALKSSNTKSQAGTSQTLVSVIGEIYSLYRHPNPSKMDPKSFYIFHQDKHFCQGAVRKSFVWFPVLQQEPHGICSLTSNGVFISFCLPMCLKKPA